MNDDWQYMWWGFEWLLDLAEIYEYDVISKATLSHIETFSLCNRKRNMTQTFFFIINNDYVKIIQMVVIDRR